MMRRAWLLLLAATAAASQVSLVLQVQNVDSDTTLSNFQGVSGSVPGAVVDVAYGLRTAACPKGAYCLSGVQRACPPASFQPFLNQFAASACLPCAAGTYGPMELLAACLACPLAELCPASVSVPLPCPAGGFCAGNASSATPCPAGSYCPGGVSAPTACPAGSYCPAGASAPTPCPVTDYAPTAGLSTCLNCPASTYCPSTGRSAPVVCPRGALCVANSAAPTACLAGSYCPPGSSAATGCPLGSFCPANASAPMLCPPGTYRAFGQLVCTACPLGQACATGGLAAGANCSAGTYANATGLSACIACPVGTYSNATGRSAVCPACPVGAYCPAPTQALACPVNTNSSAGAANLLGCICNPGFVCGYYKTITVTFTVANVSLADFTRDADGVQTRFLASVAAAAGVDVASVSLVSAVAAPTARRLLQLEARAPPALSVRVALRSDDADALQRLQARADYEAHRLT